MPLLSHPRTSPANWHLVYWHFTPTAIWGLLAQGCTRCQPARRHCHPCADNCVAVSVDLLPAQRLSPASRTGKAMTVSTLPADSSYDIPRDASRGPASRRSSFRFLHHMLAREEPASPREELEAEAADQALLEASRAEGVLLEQPEANQAPPPCAFLRPGQTFEGRQRVAALGLRKNEHWGVHVTIHSYNAEHGSITGTMTASNVPEAAHPVTTYFEGEVVDNVNHSFWTSDWAACAQTDLRHWGKFTGFQSLREEVVKSGGRSSRLCQHPWVFMRWKERYFLRGSESRLTIAGFYYLALNRQSGAVEGLYYDPSSSPDQHLELEAVTGGDAGHAFGHYELA